MCLLFLSKFQFYQILTTIQEHIQNFTQMNNQNNDIKKEFHIVTNMKMYFTNNIGQIIKPKEEEMQDEISSKSNYVLLPDLKSMVINFVDSENDEYDQLSINRSMYTLSSTAASKNIFPTIISSLIDESFSLNSECDEF